MTLVDFRGPSMAGQADIEYKWRPATQEYVMIEATIGRTGHSADAA